MASAKSSNLVSQTHKCEQFKEMRVWIPLETQEVHFDRPC